MKSFWNEVKKRYPKSFTKMCEQFIPISNGYDLLSIYDISNDGDTLYINYGNEYTYDSLRDWFEEQGIYIELIIDGWGDDKCISKDNIGYRSFVWEIGKPKPGVADDIGMSDRHHILKVSLDYCFQILEDRY